MDVNFEYYRIFYYVAKYRNFTKAAYALHNSQPNITRAMNCLEREIHCTLFIRTNRGVRLTEEGEKLFRHVSAAMMQILAAEEELTESAELEKGCVSISVSEIALNVFLLEKLKKFHMAYPKVQLKLYNHSTPQAIHSVQSGEADFAVITTPTVTDKTLKATRLCEFQEILIAGNTFQALAEFITVSVDLYGKKHDNQTILSEIIFGTRSFFGSVDRNCYSESDPSVGKA